MTIANAAQVRAEYDAVLARVGSRKSTMHFAQAAVTTFVGLILSGAAGKMAWDFGELHLGWTALVAGVGLFLLGYAAVQVVLGRKALTGELTDFEKLQALRLELRLDDPRALFP